MPPVLAGYYAVLAVLLLGTVKVATLIFISGRGSVISTAQEWKSGSIHWLSV